MSAGAVLWIDLLQLVSPFVAVGLGVLAYGRQKTIDHQHELLAERKRAYREFLTAMNRFYTAVVEAKPEAMLEQQFGLHPVAADFLCFAAPEVAPTARAYIDAVEAYYNNTKRKPENPIDIEFWTKSQEMKRQLAQSAKIDAIKAIRSDLLNEEASEGDAMIDAFFPNLKGEDQ